MKDSCKGVSLIEIIVAFSLLMILVTFSVPVIVQSYKVVTTARSTVNELYVSQENLEQKIRDNDHFVVQSVTVNGTGINVKFFKEDTLIYFKK